MVSTFLLTILLMIGLFFFIRASTKDRIEVVTLRCPESEDSILAYLRDYFQQRSYQVKAIDGERNKVTLEGLVSPSIFLAVLLSFLAGCGLFSFSLVLQMLFHPEINWFLGLIILSPIAGFFYWKGSKRVEEVAFRIDNVVDEEEKKETVFTIQAHRDELINLQTSFPFNYEVKEA
ncbi:cofactor assembly of complex C subunit B [Cyanobacterium sp. IPPAS B-1200]|uniref:cofactor assembly of complex C subunit B n=1 Tax=Cyanobacterium sp. IPPAS B-1200 TaxID=1562720 RepID=UPI00085277BB|nr:cofactor assembly of complex C subunit B [Cyanobacterium sp. IPPAS B-1200]OEJ80073.1 hypothetical protein A5482_07180 [Cyanobacterium sp. IPPAS B-1200]